MNMENTMEQHELKTLRETLVDEDKVLKALIDRAQRHFDEALQKTLGDSPRTLPFRTLPNLVCAPAELIWEVMRDAYSQGPDFAYADPLKRRLLRQALRQLNFAAYAVSQILKVSARDFGVAHLDACSHRIDVAEAALLIAQNMSGKCNPGPRNYNHPQYAKWKNLVAQCHRRIGALHIEYAAQFDQQGKDGPSKEASSQI
jgi:hypothetical protein